MDDLPECLTVMAQTKDGEIMAMQHKEYPVIGLQFHPESIYTEHGNEWWKILSMESIRR